MSGNQYQEHAEKLTRQEVEDWFIETSQSNIISKLTSRGAKLLIAPRGAGKSMLFRKAYFQCIDQKDQPFPVYVNYSHYAQVDFASSNRNDSILIFRKWVLGKILLAAIRASTEMGAVISTDEFKDINNASLLSFVQALEGGTYGPLDLEISPEYVTDTIIAIAKLNNKSRAVLFLDDAAHAFTPELQKEFFGIFRALSTTHVSPKAAVYPGITSYGDKFHSGHDAETIKIGIQPESPDYLDRMLRILGARLSEKDYSRLERIDGLLPVLAHAASGIPRGLIVMARHCLESSGAPVTSSGSTVAWDAVSEWNSYILKLYQSVASKVPRYRKYIACGEELLHQFINQIRTYNARQDLKTAFIAVELNHSHRYQSVIQYLEYAGILFERPNISRGTRGIYTRYLVHLGLLFEGRAFSTPRGKSLKATADYIKQYSSLFPQLKYNSLVGGKLDEKCELELPPCHTCGTQRAFAEAKFCTNCGAPLVDAPIYSELIRQPISKLPLPAKKLSAMEKAGGLHTIGDLLQQNIEQKLQQLERIGPIWAAKIVATAEDFTIA